MTRRNKRINMILALVLSIVLWMYVIGEINPTADRTFSDVPVTFTNIDVLADRGLAISSISIESVNVTVQGTRSTITALTESDVKVLCDVSAVNKGENEVTLDVRPPDNTTVTKMSMSKIVVTVDDLEQKEVPVQVVYEGHLPDNEEATTTQMSQTRVTISGAESLVDSVEYAQATIDSSAIGDEELTQECQLVAVTEDGTPVNRVVVEPETVGVTSILSHLKTVDLTVPIVDDSNDGATRTVEVPSKVTIAGRADTLKHISTLTAEPVTITNLAGGTELTIALTLPDGITLSDKNEDLVVVVQVESAQEKAFTINAGDIQLEGASDFYDYTFEDGFTANVVIKGKKDEISAIKASDITVTADVSELDTTSTTVTLTVTCTKTNSGISISPGTARIVIAEK